MLTQLFKIMWHRKGRNALLLIEIFFSFLVLFLTGTFLAEGLINYYTPAGFDYTDVYNLEFRNHNDKPEVRNAKLQQIRQVLQSFPEISNYSLTNSNTPYSFNQIVESVQRDGKEEHANQYLAEPAYLESLDIELSEGRWFQKSDGPNTNPVVINETLKNKFFPDEEAVGQKIKLGIREKNYEVIGVVKHFRQDGEFSAPETAFFEMYYPGDTTSSPSNIIIEIKAGVESGWQQPLLDKLNEVAGDWSIDLTPTTDMRADKRRTKMIPLIALSVVCGFLIFNVALGMFGVLYQNINRRYSEIGIRRALGATASSIRTQMVAEVMVLATLGIAVGLLLALQFPILGVMNVGTSVYLISISASLLLIYLLVALCAWFPSRQAAQIEPAIALHYE
jgi:putative ABC transport system permease protein